MVVRIYVYGMKNVIINCHGMWKLLKCMVMAQWKCVFVSGLHVIFKCFLTYSTCGNGKCLQKDIGVDGKIILKHTLRKIWSVWTTFNFLKIWPSRGFLWAWQWIFESNKTRRISWPTPRLCSMESVIDIDVGLLLMQIL